MGFFFLLRSAEYLETSTTNSISDHIIRRCNVQCFDRFGVPTMNVMLAMRVEIFIPSRNTDEVGVGVTRILQRSRSSWFCPVIAVCGLLADNTHLPDSAPLCAFGPYGDTISAEEMFKKIQRAASDAGQNGVWFSTFSFRRGGVLTLFNAGFGSVAITKFGCWKANCAERYTTVDDQATMCMAHVMGRTSRRVIIASASPRPYRDQH